MPNGTKSKQLLCVDFDSKLTITSDRTDRTANDVRIPPTLPWSIFNWDANEMAGAEPIYPGIGLAALGIADVEGIGYRAYKAGQQSTRVLSGGTNSPKDAVHHSWSPIHILSKNLNEYIRKSSAFFSITRHLFKVKIPGDISFQKTKPSNKLNVRVTTYSNEV